MCVEKNYLTNLSELILKKISEKNYTVTLFARECGISRKKVSDIINRNVSEIKLSTLVKICETHDIPYWEVFKCGEAAGENGLDSIFSSIVLTDGHGTYALVKK